MGRRAAMVLLGLLALGALALVLDLSLAPAGPGVTKANFDRLKDGMTLAEVEALLGPAADTSPSGRDWGMLHNGMRHIGHTRRVWGGDDGAARIEFDEQGRVSTKTWAAGPGNGFCTNPLPVTSDVQQPEGESSCGTRMTCWSGASGRSAASFAAGGRRPRGC